MFKAKKTAETINKNFRFPVMLIERMEKMATSDEVSLNAFVIQCCEYAIKHHADSQKRTMK